MRVHNRFVRLFLGAAVLAVPACAQQWEMGVLGGGGFYMNRGISGPRGSGNVGFKPGLAAGGWIGHNSTGRLGGEIRYLFQKNDMRVTSGSNTYTFGGHSHALHYDLLLHANSIEDAVRPFIAVGGGMKGYQGTGTERAFQPLGNIAILTKTTQWKPLISFGAGVKWNISPRIVLRAEVRDYLTQVPTDVILPAPGAKLGGWFHDITPTFGISYLLQ